MSWFRPVDVATLPQATRVATAGPRDRRQSDRRGGDRRGAGRDDSDRRAQDRRQGDRRRRGGSFFANIAIAVAMLGLYVTPVVALPEPVLDSWLVTFDHIPTAEDVEVLEGVATGVHAFEHLPVAAVVIDVTDESILHHLPGVQGVWRNQSMNPLLAESTDTMRAPGAWAAGYTGEGIGIAVVDAGVDGTHPDLCAAIEFCNGTDIKTVQNVKFIGREARLDPVLVVEDLVTTDTSSGHGTHVAGIAAGFGSASVSEPNKYPGVAPDADIVGLGVGDAVEAVNVMAAFDWILDNHAQYNIKVVNNSWGPGPGTPYQAGHPVNLAVTTMHDQGIAVTFGAGNGGPMTDTMNAFSVHPDAISVAGSQKNGYLFHLSSQGVPGSELWHPDIAAPGFLIVSARASTGFYGDVGDLGSANTSVDPQDLPYYATNSGTSMASPHIAGAIAVLQDAASTNLGRYLTPDEALAVLQHTAVREDSALGPGGMPNYQLYSMGAGHANLEAAVAAVEAGQFLTPWDDGLTHDVKAFAGQVGPAAVLPLQNFDTSFEVGPGAQSLDVMVDWTVGANDVDIDLRNPAGQTVRSTFLLCNQAAPNGYSSFCSTLANERVTYPNPEPGVWTATIRGGLTNTLEDVQGLWSVAYPDGTATSTTPAATISLELGAPAGVAGGDPIEVTATVRDANGVGIPGAPLTWTSTGVGEVVFGESASHGYGWAGGQIHAELPGTQTLTVTSGAASASIDVSWVGVELPDLPPPPCLLDCGDPEPEPQNTPGEVEAGGWVQPAGTKHTFGLWASYEAGADLPNGEVSFNDHDGTMVKVEAVETLIIDGTTATFTAPASVNGDAGYEVEIVVEDNGQPGKNSDTFQITITSPSDPSYSYTTSGVLGGGNVVVTAG